MPPRLREGQGAGPIRRRPGCGRAVMERSSKPSSTNHSFWCADRVFLGFIRSGTPPEADGEEGIAGMRALIAIERADLTRRHKQFRRDLILAIRPPTWRGLLQKPITASFSDAWAPCWLFVRRCRGGRPGQKLCGSFMKPWRCSRNNQSVPRSDNRVSEKSNRIREFFIDRAGPCKLQRASASRRVFRRRERIVIEIAKTGLTSVTGLQ